MSSRDDQDQDLPNDALKQTTLDDPTDGAIGEDAKTNASAATQSSGSQESPANGEGSQGDDQARRKGTHDVIGHDTQDEKEDALTSSTQGAGPTNISFAASESVLGAEENTQTPALTRRKSSLSTIGSRLKRASSTEKHVTILDNAGDIAVPEGGAAHGEQAWGDKGKEDDAAKAELAKIVMQFDPLADSKKPQEDLPTETVLDRGIAASKMMNPVSAAASPNLSLSSCPSPKSPQLLDSPKTSHDVQIAMFEKAKSGSSKKKSAESRLKNSVSPDSSRSNDRETIGNTTSNNDGGSRSEPPKPKEVPFDFHKFLEQMRHRSALPISRYFQSFLKEFDKKEWTVNEQIKIIHDFLDFITGKMEVCDLWKNASDQEFENVKEGMEKLVMNRLFPYTFSPSTTDDAERDEVLSHKIRIFRWIKEEHLDIPHSPYNEAYLNNAQAELKKINSFKAPRDKVICILNCCKFIFTLIRRAEGASKGADTFLPILIYVVLRANPLNLVSNVQYISRFRNPDKLQAEAGYYLASLMGAISFIESLEASSLSISPEEFDQQIEKTMTELKQEKADAVAAAAADAAKAASSSSSSEQGTLGHRKQDSKLATLLAGTAVTKNSRQKQPNTEKQYLGADAVQQQQQQYNEKSSGQQYPGGGGGSKASPAPSGSSILNPAAALIERGANFATKTIQRPLDLIERMFQDSEDEEDMAKPYPPRPGGAGQRPQPPPLPYRTNGDNQQHQQRPAADALGEDDAFSEFVYVPTSQQLQQPAPQQASGLFQQQHNQDLQGYPGMSVLQNQQQHPHQQLTTEGYLQALETLTDMFPSCERQVCDVILQANDGRLSPSIDTLLEISSGNDDRGQQVGPEIGGVGQRPQQDLIEMGDDAPNKGV